MIKNTNINFGEIVEGQSVAEFQLEKWPFYWITRTNGLYLKKLEQELKSSGLDVPSWRVLMLLGDGRARSISYLAIESVGKLSTMTRIIQRMKSEGLVKVRQRETDARVTEALLTRKGEKARLLAWEHAINVIDKAFQGVTQKDLKVLIKSLSTVMENLED